MLIATWLTGQAVAVAADAPALDAKVTAGDHAAVGPGQIVTVSWLVTNPSAETVRLHERYTLPAGWSFLPMDADASVITVAPQAAALRLAAFTVPSSAPAGDYSITCEWVEAVVGTGSLPVRSSLRAAARAAITVQNRDQLELSVRSAPPMAIAGETYVVTLSAVNRGNSVLHVKAAARVSNDFPFALEPADFTLAPGAALAVTARITPPATLARSATALFEGRLTANDVAAEATVLTEVYTARSTEDAPRWPSLLETRWISQPGQGSRQQATLSGFTRSDDGGQFNYLLRSAGVKNGGLFSEPEQYSLDYEGRRFSWRAGQHPYALSPLTTRPQFGSGAAVALKGADGWSGAAFAMNSRETASVASQFGASITYAVTPELGVTFNALGKREGAQQTFAGERSATVSVETRYAPSAALDARLELGASPLRPTGTTGSPSAQRLEINGTAGGTAYRATAENYGAAFFGALRRAQTLTTTVTQRLTPAVDVHAEQTLHAYANAYSLPGTQLATNREATRAAGTTWHVTSDLQLTLDGQQADRSFAFTATPTRYQENTWRGGIRHAFRQFVWETSVEAGTLHAKEGDVRQAPIRRGNVSLFWNPTPRQNYSIFATAGNDPYSPVAASARTVGASAHAVLGEKFSATFQVGQNLYDAREARRRSYFSGEVSYRISERQTVGVKTSWAEKSSATGGGLAFALSYTRALNLPAPSLSRRSSITGTLTDAGTGRPLRRVVVVLNGRSAVTDAQGRYAFTELRPGTYTLTVDPRSLGSRLVREKLPLVVKLDRAEAQQIALSAEPAGRVLVRLTGEKTDASDAAARPTAGLVVQLQCDQDGTVLSELTDGSGLATFSTVRAGTWKMKFDSAQLPPRYRIAQMENTVDVPAAGTRQTEVALKYEAPAIRWVASE